MEYIELASYNTFYPLPKTDTKSIGVYIVLRCCVLLNKKIVSHEMGQAKALGLG